MTNQIDPHAEQEWAAQEHSEREERLGLTTMGVEPRVAQYRLIARVLSEPVNDQLPPHFAAAVAARVEAASQPADDPIDRWLQRGLFVLLALAAIAFWSGSLVALISGDEMRAVPAVQWAYAIGLCIALSFLIDIWTTWSAGRKQLPAK